MVSPNHDSMKMRRKILPLFFTFLIRQKHNAIIGKRIYSIRILFRYFIVIVTVVQNTTVRHYDKVPICRRVVLLHRMFSNVFDALNIVRDHTFEYVDSNYILSNKLYFVVGF